MKTGKFFAFMRILLGVVLIFFGIMGLVQEELPPMTPEAKQLAQALVTAGYFFVLIPLLNLVIGIMLVSNRFAPLALVLLTPITLNILLFHIFLDPKTIAPAIFLMLVQIYLMCGYTKVYKPLFMPKHEE